MSDDESRGGFWGALRAFLGWLWARILGLFGRPYPYEVRRSLLTPAETDFYQALRGAVDDHVQICLKVRLGDVIGVRASHAADYRFWARVNHKHIDFILADAATLQPLAGVELDDASHQDRARQARDREVDQIFAAAGLPLLHIPFGWQYDTERLASKVRAALAGGQVVRQASARRDARSSGPRCPHCGGAMVLRTARSGPHEGERFYGCADYPNCHGTRPVIRASE